MSRNGTLSPARRAEILNLLGRAQTAVFETLRFFLEQRYACREQRGYGDHANERGPEGMPDGSSVARLMELASRCPGWRIGSRVGADPISPGPRETATPERNARGQQGPESRAGAHQDQDIRW